MKRRSLNPRRTQSPSPTPPRAAVVPIESRIVILRHQKIILDTALAEIYGVPVKRLNQQVNRNRERFPADFMFQVTTEEAERSRSQIVTSKSGRGQNIKYRLHAFIKHGAIQAANVLT